MKSPDKIHFPSKPGRAGTTQKNDWKWQLQNRIRSADELIQMFPSLSSARAIDKVAKKYPFAITPYYASLIRKGDFSDPIFRMAVPQIEELYNPPFLKSDPLKEKKQMPLPRLIRRFPDRALIVATSMCAAYCRHCTRKSITGTAGTAISSTELERIKAYLEKHPAIKDVLISGGDPLTMPTETLEIIISSVRSVKSVEIIRICTRTPVTLPQRITCELVSMLKKYHPLWINTHFNHPREITAESSAACARLADAGIPLGNQSVLLRGVNDTPEIIEELCRALVRIRVRPYYLFQCDLVKGIEHFRTPVKRGIEIMEYLRGRLGGLAIPLFVVDAIHNGGKIPVAPNYIVSTDTSCTVLRNCDGIIVKYPEPIG